MNTSNFYVITPYSNHLRYESRPKLYQKFMEHMADSGMADNVITVELAFGDRPFEVTTGSNLRHLQLRTWSELWHKENMGQLALAHTFRHFPDCDKVGWFDGDIQFADVRGWAKETVQQLEHYMVVQPWSHAVDLGPNEEVTGVQKSFMYQYRMGKVYNGNKYELWHPGYAWAFRKEALEATGGFIDRAILGAADHHMAVCLIGQPKWAVPQGLNDNYYRMIDRWAALAEERIRRDVGYVDNMLTHFWHGKKRQRFYVERWDVLRRNDFDPYNDVGYDVNGVLEWRTRKLDLIWGVHDYFRSRNEDSIDLD